MDTQLSIEFAVSVLQDIISAGYGFLKQENLKRDFFGRATKSYLEKMINLYSEVKIIGMSTPAPLLDLYIRANILEKIASRSGTTKEELEKKFDFDRRSFGKQKETIDGEEIVNRFQRFIVLGKPGAGKTTFLRYLALAMLSNITTVKQRRLPIIVTLRHWTDEKIDLIDYITQQFDICGFEQAELFIKHALKQGNCLVLLDGLDEVSQETNLDHIIRQIRNFTDKYEKNQFIMSCRVAAYNYWFDRFTDVEMADFNEIQIEQFVRNWFKNELDTGSACWDHLKNNKQLKEMASTPLLLTLLCITFNRKFYFPQNRAELYGKAIEALLEEWDSSRRIHRDDPFSQLSVKRKEEMFAHIAYYTFKNNQYFIPEKELTRLIEDYIRNLPDFNEKSLEISSKEILKNIEANHGVFVERAEKIHSFAHLTFQEYFTAKYIVDKAARGTLENLVEEHFYEEKWKEVFLLTAGMLPEADHLLILMTNKQKEIQYTFLVSYFLNGVESIIINKESKYSKYTRKAFGVYVILLFDLTQDPDKFYDYFTKDLFFVDAYNLGILLEGELDPVTEINIKLDKEISSFYNHGFYFFEIVNIDPFKESDQEYYGKSLSELQGFLSNARNLIYPLASIFDLNTEIAQFFTTKNHFFSSGMFKKLKLFIRGNILLISCLKSDIYLSKELRESILNEMFSSLSDQE